MSAYPHVKIAYYSGTGGTAMAAKQFMTEFQDNGCPCTMDLITDGCSPCQTAHSLLILLFPVHAFRAPGAIDRWIDRLPTVTDRSAVIISVSGGGEISPNTACRLDSKRRLVKKGYHVIYDAMIVMPSNFVVATNETLAAMLLQVLPTKINHMVTDILSKKQSESSPLRIDRLFSILGKLERPVARLWGKFIRPLNHCSGCGWCAKNCPSGNIVIEKEKPIFSNRCHLCLKCIYGCPQKALTPGIGKFVVIKGGYDLHHFLENAPLNEKVDIEHLAGGYLWSGVKQYLLEEMVNSDRLTE